MTLSYEEVRDASFLEEVHKHDIADENVLQRFGNCEACLLLLNNKHAQKMKVIYFFIGLHFITAMVVFPYLQQIITNERVMSSLQFIFSITTLVLYATFFLCWRAGLRNRLIAVTQLAEQKKYAFYVYFSEFVQHQILPSVNLDHLKTQLSGGVNDFSVLTKADKKHLDLKNMTLVGVYKSDAESVEVSIVLKFNKDYSRLELKNYHVNQYIASSRFGGSDNGS